MRSLITAATALLLSASAVAGPTKTGPVLMPPADSGLAVSALSVQGGRVAGLPSVLVEVRQDGVAVEGEPVLVLSAGVLNPRPGQLENGVILPVYERIIGKVGGREFLGAEPPFLGVMAVDAQVPAATLSLVLESARLARAERLLFLVDDAVAREPWMPEPLPEGAARLQDPSYNAVIDVSDKGFEIIDVAAILTPRDLRGLACPKTCSSVAELPWDALDRVLGTLADKSEEAPLVRVMTRQGELPSGALIRAVGTARQHFDVVTLAGLAGKEGGGRLSLGDGAGASEAISLSGKLVGVSSVLARPAEDEGVVGIPEFQIRQALDRVAGRTRGCAAQGGPDTVITVRFEVDEDGAVSAATVTDTSVKARAPGKCVLSVVREVSFPKPMGTAPFVVNWTFDATEE